MKRIVALCMLAGCGDGPAPETLIDTLRVVAAVSDPPEVAVEEPHLLAATVVDPEDLGAEVLVWSCLPEAATTEDCRTWRPEVFDETALVELQLVSPLPVWVLACAPGVCDLDDPQLRDLTDPTRWMRRLPLEQASLAYRAPRLLEDPTAERAENPTVDERPDPGRVQRAGEGEAIRLGFRVPGARRAWGYTTSGGFEMPAEDVDDDGNVTLRWYAPEGDRSRERRLYVVFENDEGGATVWRSTAAE